MNYVGRLEFSSTDLVPATPTPTATPWFNADAQQLELIERIKHGDSEAFYELVRPYERAIYATAFSILRNAADAEEIAQETVLRAFANLARFRGECKLSTWLIQITINEARARSRKDRRHLYDSIDEAFWDVDGEYVPQDIADSRAIPIDSIENSELGEAIQRSMASLTPKLREVFVLRDVQEFSIAETAEILRIKEEAVKTRLLRARLQMRDELAKYVQPKRVCVQAKRCA